MAKQTTIPAPPNRHSYRKGLDATLQAQQLQEILARNPNVKVYPRAKSGTPEPVPLFPEPRPEQAELF